MSTVNTGSLPDFSLLQQPSFSHSSQVMAKIESQVGSIRELWAEISAILAELSAARDDKPQHPGPKASDKALAAYQSQMTAWTQKVNKLTRRLETTQRKLHEAEAILRQLQTRELPDAERKDADDNRERLAAARKALEASAQAMDNTDEVKGEDAAEEVERIHIRAILKKVEIFKSDPTLKQAIQLVSLLINTGAVNTDQIDRVTGRGRLNPPATGVPPVSMP